MRLNLNSTEESDIREECENGVKVNIPGTGVLQGRVVVNGDTKTN